jgi:hypothetical protein
MARSAEEGAGAGMAGSTMSEGLGDASSGTVSLGVIGSGDGDGTNTVSGTGTGDGGGGCFGAVTASCCGVAGAPPALPQPSLAGVSMPAGMGRRMNASSWRIVTK